MNRIHALLPAAGAIALAAAFAGPVPVLAAHAVKPARTAPRGYDVSWPQCGSRLPSGAIFAVVGVTYGLPYSANPCLASEYKWGRSTGRAPDLYMNLAEPGNGSVHWNKGGPRPCSGASNDAGCAYDYGWEAAAAAWSVAAADNPAASRWWVDIETGNTWAATPALNTADIQGAVDSLASLGARATGVYSTGYQWGQITGGASLAASSVGAPADWLAGASSATKATSWCTGKPGFSGGRISVVQYPAGSFDGDVTC
jgi:hypothetical protein